MVLRTASAFVLLSLASACGSPPPAAAPKPPEPEKQAVPPCPESILPGGDPIEAESFEGKPVVRVCVLGPDAESRAAAQKVIELRASEIYSVERVRADLEAILKIGMFDDASAYGLRVQQGSSIVLFYSVHDRPRIASIAFEGAKLFGDASLDAKLPIQKGAPYDPALLNGMAQAIRSEYQARGYEGAAVTLATEPAGGAPPQVKVRIKVVEGPRWHYSRVDFKGAKKVPEADLRKAAGLAVDQPYVSEEVERAQLVVTALYYDRGYVQVQVKTDVGAPDATGAAPLTFAIDEGDVHVIGTLHASKLGLPVEKELLEKVVKTRPKQVFSRSQLVEDIQRMQAFFEKRGQHVEILPLTNIDPKKHIVDLTFEVDAK